MAEYQSNEELKAIVIYQAKRIIDLEHDVKRWQEIWVRQSTEMDKLRDEIKALKEQVDYKNF